VSKNNKRIVLDGGTLNIEKRLDLSGDNSRKHKLSAYEIDWLDPKTTQIEILKYLSIKNLPPTQEQKLTFLLEKYQASDIKTAFADLIGRIGDPARKAFYPPPTHKDKLIKNFLNLICNARSVIVDRLENSP
jgi:phage FluMu gp28-like protein